MLKVGDVAPNFTFVTQQGETKSLQDYRGKKVILYFFPKAFTKGCTIETRQFHQSYAEFQSLGAEIIGISVDSKETQCEFAQKENVTFPMVSDEDGSIGKLYKTLWPILGVNKRVTYVMDGQGKIAAVFHHELRVNQHIENVKQFLLASHA